jgi:integrase
MRTSTLTKLSAQRVKTLKDPGLHSDGGGLYLSVTSAGTKSWVFVYKRSGKRREMGLGSFNSVSLALARDKAAGARADIAQGRDPIQARDAEGLESPAFSEFSKELITELAAGWTSSRHHKQWTDTLDTHAASLQHMLVCDITTEDMLKLLKPIWLKIPTTADRVRNRIEIILDAAKARGFRKGENPARWRGHLQHLLPKRPKAGANHHPAMPYGDVPTLMQDLRAGLATSVRGIELTILNANRKSEVVGATWSELDLDNGLWTIPGARMKGRIEHVVPLSRQSIALFRALIPPTGAVPEMYVFPSPSNRRRPITAMSLNNMLKRIEGDGPTLHGFRSSFRDWAGDMTEHPRDLIEMCMAHNIGNAVERAYRRAKALEKRREIMQDWADFILPMPPAVAQD